MFGHIVNEIVVMKHDGEITCLFLLFRQPCAEQMVNAVVDGVMTAFMVNDGITPSWQLPIEHAKIVCRHRLGHAACNVKHEVFFWHLLRIGVWNAIGVAGFQRR